MTPAPTAPFDVWMVRSWDPDPAVGWSDPQFFATRGNSWECLHGLVSQWRADLERSVDAGVTTDTHDHTTWVLHQEGNAPMVVAERVTVNP